MYNDFKIGKRYSINHLGKIFIGELVNITAEFNDLFVFKVKGGYLQINKLDLVLGDTKINLLN